MSKVTLCPEAVERLTSSKAPVRGRPESGRHGILGAFVPGAVVPQDCVRAGWPWWFAETLQSLYQVDAGHGPGAEQQLRANEWAMDIAHAIARPVHYTHAQTEFSLRLLRRLRPADQNHCVAWLEAHLLRKQAGHFIGDNLSTLLEKQLGAYFPTDGRVGENVKDPEQAGRLTFSAVWWAAAGDLANAASTAVWALGAHYGEDIAAVERLQQRHDLELSLLLG